MSDLRRNGNSTRLVVTDSGVVGNLSDGSGGGISLTGNDSVGEITRTVVRSNDAVNDNLVAQARGGGVNSFAGDLTMGLDKQRQ